MRKLKKRIIVPALGLALLIVASVFMPAGAATTSEREGDAVSQEFVLCETDASGVIEKINVYNVLSVAERANGGSFDFKMTNEFAGEEGAKVSGTSSFKAPELDGDYIVWRDVNAEANANYVADTKFSKSMLQEAKTRIPVDVEYKYYFNGKLVGGPEDIEGKDGHFRLECTMKNVSAEKTPVKYKDPNTGETVVVNTDVYLPLVISPYMWQWDNQHFFNMETDPTCLNIYKPDVYQTGWTIPLFPPATDEKFTIWVEADVKDFRMPVLTLVCAFVFPETNQNDVLAQLGPGIAQLYDGVKQLDSGLTGAVAGLGSATTPATLIYGISEIYDGLLKLSSDTEGLGYAKAGLDDSIIPAVDQMYTGIGSTTTPETLLYAAGATQAGLETMSGAIGSTTTDGTLLYGVDSLSTGLNSVVTGIGSATTPDTLLYATDAVQGGLNSLNAGLSQVMLGLSNGSPTGGILEAITAMKGGLDAPYPNGAIAALQAMAAGIGPAATPGTLLNQINQLIAMFSVDNFPTAPPNCTMYAYVNHNAAYGGTMNAQDIAVLNGMMSALAGQLTAALPQITAMYNGLVAPYPNGLIAGLQAMSTGMGQIIAGIGNAANPATLLGGLAAMQAGIGSVSTPDTLLYAMARVQFALLQMQASFGSASTPDTALYGLAQMQFGLAQMQGGIGSATTQDTLLYAVNAINGGMTQIKYGLSSGSAANPAVKEGLVQISGGLGEAVTALGSSSTPDTALYGTNLVKEGMVTLQEGLTQATTEGTQMMITAMDGSLTQINLTEGELEAIKERAAEFDAFLGKPVSGESEVRFVMQTPPTYGYADSSTGGIVALVLSIVIAIALVLLGLFAFRKLA